jgi:HSP20 family protein
VSVRKLIERSIAAREEMDLVLHEAADFLRSDEHGPVEHPPDSWAPMVDVTESEQGFHVSVELPGVDQEDVAVEVTGNRLTIAGRRRQAKERHGERPFFRERSFGPFERKILLPCGAVEDDFLVTFRLGVLTVTLLKA